MSRLPERIFVGLDSSSPTCGVEVLKAHDRQSYGLTEYVRADIHAAALAAERAKVRELVEALETWQKFFDTMPKGQFGKISCDVGLLNEGFIKMRVALEKYKDEPNA